METKICKDCGRELPITNFKLSRIGVRVGVCTECATRKMRENKEKKRIEMAMQVKEQARIERQMQDTLGSFTPRQLMEELARRGYRGELTFVQKIDITHF